MRLPEAAKTEQLDELYKVFELAGRSARLIGDIRLTM